MSWVVLPRSRSKEERNEIKLPSTLGNGCSISIGGEKRAACQSRGK